MSPAEERIFRGRPTVTLDRNERVRLMGKFRGLARGSWAVKAKGKHRGVITRTAEAVFEALIYLVEKYLFPKDRRISHAVVGNPSSLRWMIWKPLGSSRASGASGVFRRLSGSRSCKPRTPTRFMSR